MAETKDEDSDSPYSEITESEDLKTIMDGQNQYEFDRERTQAAVNDCLVVDSIDAMDYSVPRSKQSSPSPATDRPGGMTTIESRNNQVSPSPYNSVSKT